MPPKSKKRRRYGPVDVEHMLTEGWDEDTPIPTFAPLPTAPVFSGGVPTPFSGALPIGTIPPPGTVTSRNSIVRRVANRQLTGKRINRFYSAQGIPLPAMEGEGRRKRRRKSRRTRRRR